MARQARLVVPEYPHHVTQRGGRGQQTFFRQSDFEMYIDLLAQGKPEAAVDIWAYCLMPNHVHLIVVPSSANGLSRLFRGAHAEYARRINKREGWQGHLWQERFHSFVMEDSHLLAAVRYVELNPVRAGLCPSAWDWQWSSANAHLAGRDDSLVSVAPMCDRIDDWARFLGAGNSDDELEGIRSHSSNGRPFGDDRFVRTLERQTGRELRPSRRRRRILK